MFIIWSCGGDRALQITYIYIIHVYTHIADRPDEGLRGVREVRDATAGRRRRWIARQGAGGNETG